MAFLTKHVPVTLLLTYSPFTLAAPLMNLSFGAGTWAANFNGALGTPAASSATDTGNDTGDTGGTSASTPTLSNLNFVEEMQNYYFLRLNHSIPGLPQLKAYSFDIEQQATTTASSDFTIDGVNFATDAAISSALKLSYNEVTLHYPLLNNWFSFNMGVTLRAYDGSTNIFTPTDDSTTDGDGGTTDDQGTTDGDGGTTDDQGTTDGDGGTTDDQGTTDGGTTDGGDTTGDQTNAPTSVAQNLEGNIPLLHIESALNIPNSNWQIKFVTNHSSFGDDTFSDQVLTLGYISSASIVNIGFEIGYRKITIESEDLFDIQTDLEFDGYFAGLILKF